MFKTPFPVILASLIRLATSRPLGERSEPFLAAERPTASDEVDPMKDFFESLPVWYVVLAGADLDFLKIRFVFG